MHGDLSFGSRVSSIWDEAWQIARAAPIDVGAYLLVMIVGITLLDLYASEIAATFAVGVGALAAAFALTLNLVRKGVDGGQNGGRGFLSYFGISLLSGIAICLGLLLLIVPGLVLWARWMPAYGYALGDGLSANEALSKSWDETRGHVVPILGAALPPFLVGSGGSVAIVFIVEGFGQPVWWSSLIANALVYTSQAASIAIGLAIFSLHTRHQSAITDVFE